MMKWMIYIFLSGVMNVIFAQNEQHTLHFNVTFDDAPIVLGKNYYSETLKDSISFDRIRFYISDIRFLDDNKVVGQLKKKHFLIDLENEDSQKIKTKNVAYNKLHFHLGVDSLTNHSGVHGDDLDPTKGMYWTWQSGYINFKLEGTTPSCPARHHTFQYHLGGFQHPYNALQTITLSVPEQPSEVVINLPIDTLLTRINISTTYQVMSPGVDAMEIAKHVAAQFEISK